MEKEQKYGNIFLVKKKPENTASELKDIFPSKKICVCDFYVSDSENGKIKGSGITDFSDLLVVDHHMPDPYMMQQISSTLIANKFVSEHGPLNDEYVIVINHTDTDSILSSLIMGGKLKPDSEYDKAAIAADHTGKENIISDLLQSFEDDRNLKTSIEVLLKIMEKRLWVRKEMKALIQDRKFEMHNDIALIKTEKKIDACLLLDALTNVKVVVVASPMPKGSQRKWRIRVRSSISGKVVALNKLNLPNTGGRWNAVSTSRYGGTDMEPKMYVEMLRHEIEQRQKKAHGMK